MSSLDVRKFQLRSQLCQIITLHKPYIISINLTERLAISKIFVGTTTLGCVHVLKHDIKYLNHSGNCFNLGVNTSGQGGEHITKKMNAYEAVQCAGLSHHV